MTRQIGTNKNDMKMSARTKIQSELNLFEEVNEDLGSGGMSRKEIQSEQHGRGATLCGYTDYLVEAYWAEKKANKTLTKTTFKTCSNTEQSHCRSNGYSKNAKYRSLRLTYALAVLEERERAVPRVQVDPDDGALAKAGGEVHLVSFVVQQTWKQRRRR